MAVFFALGYLVQGALRSSLRSRAWTIAAASVFLVMLPSLAFVAMGHATDRPYGQDGGVVQLPFALDLIFAGESPYGADYSKTMLGRQARASSFWEGLGENPILHHHAYLPGTHLLMSPFYLLARGLGVPFDPRLVTLIFYVLTIVLAARVPDEGPLRLLAAAVAALNPLVYWHQIFGANDLVFVALLLGAALLARDGRTTWAGALTGLACATKQLAWPFAPFLLLSLAGARSFSDFGRQESWSRIARPLIAAAAVFLAVVLPVAALDFRAFWGDIVVYNVGLPGADNYPLGGTPGFGFANFLIYFGRVGSLRDYFPFGIFYLLLVPLGLLLLRAQLREGTPVAALYLGTAALLLSLYFSRVVHPNYLIPAAVLLPVALLRLRCPPDVALVPLLLLLLAVEMTENAVFRETWEQATAAGWPARLGGLVAALAPLAGPDLTPDPLGLFFGAAAAGCAVAYLVASALGLPPRGRIPLLAVAALLVIAVPAGVVRRVGERTGVVRAQDRWAVQVQADAARIGEGRSPYAPPAADQPMARQAFSTSFRLEPPAEFLPDRPLSPPGTATLVALLRPLGLRDPRPLLLAALVVLAVTLALAGWRAPVAVAVALVPPLALGSVLGSHAALPAAALVAAFAARHPAAAGFLAGVAAGFDHRAASALPFLIVDQRNAWRSVLGGAFSGYLLLVLPAAWPDPVACLRQLFAWPAPGPGVGLGNVFYYWGGVPSGPGLMLIAGLATAALGVLAWRGRLEARAGAAIATLIAVFLSASPSPDALGLPIAVLALAGVGDGEESGA